jgi:alpha-glucan phosphorylase-like protein
VLDPDALTIGFARRFATYKRGDLVFRDIERLIRIANQTDRPVQFIFAGKAHPADAYGKEIIKRIVQFARRPELRRRVVFIEDYDVAVARAMVQGVDVWLNTPRRPLEASGTSGMKAAVNGRSTSACSTAGGSKATTAKTAGRSGRAKTTPITSTRTTWRAARSTSCSRARSFPPSTRAPVTACRVPGCNA